MHQKQEDDITQCLTADEDGTMHRPRMRDYVNEQPYGETNLSERRRYHLLFLSIGALCIVQGVLNLLLRLTLYSNKIVPTSACNISVLGDENHKMEEETECERMKPDQCRKFLEVICALKRDRRTLEKTISKLTDEKKTIEEERDRLKMNPCEQN